MISRLLSLISNASFIRKFSVLVGLLAIITIIWLLGPNVGLRSISWRLTIILMLIVGVALFYGIRYLRDKKQGDALVDDITEQTQANAVDVAELKNKMQQAISSLKSSELGAGRGSSVLYRLPWYMVIGPSAAGKTTLLRNSGLKFPLASDEDVRVTGYGGTRNCDWWFSDQAVIIDTAGRYTTEVNDKEEWVSFLNILKKRRRKLPINGVIVAISLTELLTSDSENLNWHASVVRDRLEELTQQLGYVLPVNVVLTKSDLLKGFSEFFKHFTEKDREQVWGVNLLQDKKDNNNTENTDIFSVLKQKFAELYAALSEVRIQQLAVEQNQQAKTRLYDFPAQFQQATQKLYDFFERLINNNPYQNPINLSGVYFTSGCQEGYTVQRDIASDQFSQSSMLDGNATGSYFIRRLLLDVIFTNKFGATLSRRMKLLRSWLKTTFITTGGILILLGLIFWGIAYFDSKHVLNNSVSVVKNLQQVVATPNVHNDVLIAAQVKVYQQYHMLQDHKQLIPFYARLGLYQGDKQLPNLEKILLSSLQKDFMTTVPASISKRLAYYNTHWKKMSSENQAKRYNDYYNSLKGYLQLGLKTPVTELDAKYLANVWALRLGKHGKMAEVGDIDAEQLAKLTNFYINSDYTGLSADQVVKPWRPNITLVKQARKNLFRPINANDVYQSVRAELQDQLPPLSIGDLVKSDDADLLRNNETIPGVFTAKAWKKQVIPALHKAAEQASSGDWVLSATIGISNRADRKPDATLGKGDPAVQKRLDRLMRKHYFADYVSTWYNWLSNVNVSRFVSLHDASEGLHILADEDGPISQLMQSISDNINVPNSESDDSIAPELLTPFAPLRQFAGGDTGEESVTLSLEKYLANIGDIRKEIQALSIDPTASKKAKVYAMAVLQGNASDKKLYNTRTQISRQLIDVKNAHAKMAIDNVLTAPLRGTWRSMLNEAAKDIQTQWESQVLPSYQNEILGNFPFQKNSDQDIGIDSVKDFFSPQNGSLWHFVHQQLQSFVEKRGMHWRAKTWLNIGMDFSTDFLPGLDQAQQISTVLFNHGDNNPSYNFSIYPIPLIDISTSTLTINGKRYRYQNGPQQWQAMHWHLRDAQQMTQLLVNKRDGEAQAQIDKGGIWSLIKLLDRASVNASGSGYLLAWHLTTSDGSAVTLRMKFKTDGPASVIKGFVEKPFELPNTITKALD